MSNNIPELFYLGKGLRKFGARQTIDTRLKVSSLIKLLQWGKYSQRKHAAEVFPAPKYLTIPEDKGFTKLELFDSNILSAAADSARSHWEQFNIQEELNKDIERPFVPQFLGKHLQHGDPILELALHPSIIGAVAKYIGMIPVIENITTWYSPNNRTLAGSSQYYHLDGQDIRTVQLFIFLDDVSTENGPLKIIRADESEALARKIKYRKTPNTKRIQDDIVESSASDITSFKGKKNQAYIADTDRCFHLGSREAKLPRHVLVIQYYSPFAFVLPRKWETALPLAHLVKQSGFTDIEKLVLGER